MPGTAMEMSESKVRNVMSFMEPHTKFREILKAILAGTFFGSNIVENKSLIPVSFLHLLLI